MQLTHEQLDTMIRHARAGLPNEACGLLAGSGDTVTAVHCLENKDHSPTTYDLPDNGYMLAAELDEKGQFLGSFHSHPRTAAYPSPTDRSKAGWRIRYVIVSLKNHKQPLVRVFRIIKSDAADAGDLGEVLEEKLEVVDATADA